MQKKWRESLKNETSDTGVEGEETRAKAAHFALSLGLQGCDELCPKLGDQIYVKLKLLLDELHVFGAGFLYHSCWAAEAAGPFSGSIPHGP